MPFAHTGTAHCRWLFTNLCFLEEEYFESKVLGGKKQTNKKTTYLNYSFMSYFSSDKNLFQNLQLIK